MNPATCIPIITGLIFALSIGAPSAWAEQKGGTEDLDPAAQFACPMKCEGAKTYPAAGSCPVCRMSLKMISSGKYEVKLQVLQSELEAGKPTALAITITEPSGDPAKKLEPIEKHHLHLRIVARDLSWFACEFPRPQAQGTFALRVTFPRPGEYILFAGFKPAGIKEQLVRTSLTVPGTAAPAEPLTVDADTPKVVDGYEVSLESGGPMTTGGTTKLAFTIDQDGNPVTDLKPLRGAVGQLVFVSQDTETMLVEESISSTATGGKPPRRGGPRVEFETSFDKPGLYRCWLQLEHKRTLIEVPFTCEVTAGAMPGGGHSGHGGH